MQHGIPLVVGPAVPQKVKRGPEAWQRREALAELQGHRQPRTSAVHREWRTPGRLVNEPLREAAPWLATRQ